MCVKCEIRNTISQKNFVAYAGKFFPKHFVGFELECKNYLQDGMVICNCKNKHPFYVVDV